MIDRYGKVEKDNPNHEYPVIVQLSIPEVLGTGDVDKKMKLLQRNKLAMKNIIKINSSGQVTNDDMTLLRILFSENN